LKSDSFDFLKKIEFKMSEESLNKAISEGDKAQEAVDDNEASSSSSSSSVALTPNQTLYVQNVREKLSVDELKVQLHGLFSQHGNILAIEAMKTRKMRGQAFVVFASVSSATEAMHALQGFVFCDRALRISYAKSKSDAVARLDGTYVFGARWNKPNRGGDDDDSQVKRGVKRGDQELDGGVVLSGGGGGDQKRQRTEKPSRVLLVDGMPADCIAMALEMVFHPFDGYKSVTMLPDQVGAALVHFDSESQAAVAMASLQNFAVTQTHRMHISFSHQQ
jgi:U2 small nuclear ribonucleoprotein B''